MKITLCTIFALLAFAGNSVLCRLALGENTIDAASFTSIRLLSGIIVLMALVSISRKNSESKSKGSWFAALMLFVYALTFSYAYISLDTGTGALILFGSVQIMMIVVGIITGNKLHTVEWVGLIVAFSGIVYLVAPSFTTPSLTGFILMMIAGSAWAFYTLSGRGSNNPLRDTAYNFLRTSPLLVILIIFALQNAHISSEGVIIAIISGAVCSGLGYSIWYVALPGLTVTQAAVIQLFAPIIAAIGGVIFTYEEITLHLVFSSCLVLGGVLIVILGKRYFERNEGKYS